VVAVAEHRIVPLVPPRLVRGAGRHALASRAARIDVAELLARPRAGSLVYGMGRVDERGAVSNRATVDALGWTAGDHLHIAVVGGSVSCSVVAYRDEGGAFAVGSKPYLVIPAAVRRRSGLRARDLVLVAADPHHGMLVVHPLAAVDAMITAYHATLTTVGGPVAGTAVGAGERGSEGNGAGGAR